MAKKLLHRPEVGAPVEQVTRECVAQNMRRYPIGPDIGLGSDILEVLRKPLPRHMPGCRLRGKKPFGIIEPAGHFEKTVERRTRCNIERHESFAAALALVEPRVEGALKDRHRG